MVMLTFQKWLFKGHLDEDENLFAVAHQHWIGIFIPIVQLVFFGIALPWVLWLFLAFSLWIVAAWIFLFIIIFLLQSFDWYFDALLITNVGIIDIEWINIFHRTSSRVNYQDLKEISYEVKGVWATILNYGSITMHLNSGEDLELSRVRNPQNVEFEIKNYKDKFLNERKMTDSTAIQEILAEIVKNHIEEHGLPVRKEEAQQPKRKRKRHLGRTSF